MYDHALWWIIELRAFAEDGEGEKKQPEAQNGATTEKSSGKKIREKVGKAKEKVKGLVDKAKEKAKYAVNKIKDQID